jgi:hypothetical protein
MSKRISPTFRSIAFPTTPRKGSPTATFEALLPETQEQYYQQERREKEDAKQEQLDLIKNRKTIQDALNARDKADEVIALLTARQAERKRAKGLGLKKSTTVSDLTKYNMRYESADPDPNDIRLNNKYEEAQMRYEEDPDPNKTWRDSERHGGRGTNLHSLGRGTNLHSLGRGTNLHSLGRRRTRTTKRRRTKQKKTKRRRNKSTRKKRRRPRRSPSKARSTRRRR